MMVAVQNTTLPFICSLWWTNGLTAHSASFLPPPVCLFILWKLEGFKAAFPDSFASRRRIQIISHQLDALVQGRNGAEDFLTPFGLFSFFLLKNIILDVGDLSKVGFQCLLEKQLWQGSGRQSPPGSGFLILWKYHENHARQGPWPQGGEFFYSKFPGVASYVITLQELVLLLLFCSSHTCNDFY